MKPRASRPVSGARLARRSDTRAHANEPPDASQTRANSQRSERADFAGKLIDFLADFEPSCALFVCFSLSLSLALSVGTRESCFTRVNSFKSKATASFASDKPEPERGPIVRAGGLCGCRRSARASND